MATARLTRAAIGLAGSLLAVGLLTLAVPPLWAALSPALAGGLTRRLAIETLKLAALCTVICLVLGAPLAWTLRLHVGRWEGRGAGLATPLMSAAARITGLVVVVGEFGLVNLVLRTMRLEAEMPRRGALLGEMTLLGGMVQVFAPFMVLALYKAMRRIEIGTVRALRSLGMSHARLFWRVAVPLSLGGAAIGVASVFALATGAYVTVAVFGGRRVRVLAGLAYEESSDLLGWQVVAIGIVLVGIGTVLLARWLAGAQRPAVPNSLDAALRTRP